VIVTPSRLRLIRKVAVLVRICPTLDLNIETKVARRKWNWTLGFVSEESTRTGFYYESMKRKL
jgi:hypothetical protein